MLPPSKSVWVMSPTTGLCTRDRTAVQSLQRPVPAPSRAPFSGASEVPCPTFSVCSILCHCPTLTEARPWWPSATWGPPLRTQVPRPAPPRQAVRLGHPHHPGAPGPLVLRAAWASAEASSPPGARPAGGAAVPWGGQRPQAALGRGWVLCPGSWARWCGCTWPGAGAGRPCVVWTHPVPRPGPFLSPGLLLRLSPEGGAVPDALVSQPGDLAVPTVSPWRPRGFLS